MRFMLDFDDPVTNNILPAFLIRSFVALDRTCRDGQRRSHGVVVVVVVVVALLFKTEKTYIYIIYLRKNPKKIRFVPARLNAWKVRVLNIRKTSNSSCVVALRITRKGEGGRRIQCQGVPLQISFTSMCM